MSSKQTLKALILARVSLLCKTDLDKIHPTQRHQSNSSLGLRQGVKEVSDNPMCHRESFMSGANRLGSIQGKVMPWRPGP